MWHFLEFPTNVNILTWNKTIFLLKISKMYQHQNFLFSMQILETQGQAFHLSWCLPSSGSARKFSQSKSKSLNNSIFLFSSLNVTSKIKWHYHHCIKERLSYFLENIFCPSLYICHVSSEPDFHNGIIRTREEARSVTRSHISYILLLNATIFVIVIIVAFFVFWR